MTDEQQNQDLDHEADEPQGDPQPVEETNVPQPSAPVEPPQESNLQTSQPDVPIEPPQYETPAEGSTSQPEEAQPTEAEGETNQPAEESTTTEE